MENSALFDDFVEDLEVCRNSAEQLIESKIRLESDHFCENHRRWSDWRAFSC